MHNTPYSFTRTRLFKYGVPVYLCTNGIQDIQIAAKDTSNETVYFRNLAGKLSWVATYTLKPLHWI